MLNIAKQHLDLSCNAKNQIANSIIFLLLFKFNLFVVSLLTNQFKGNLKNEHSKQSSKKCCCN